METLPVSGLRQKGRYWCRKWEDPYCHCLPCHLLDYITHHNEVPCCWSWILQQTKQPRQQQQHKLTADLAILTKISWSWSRTGLRKVVEGRDAVVLDCRKSSDVTLSWEKGPELFPISRYFQNSASCSAEDFRSSLGRSSVGEARVKWNSYNLPVTHGTHTYCFWF